jgi:pSer/pThr/pTyr-binding forkhead associated (FHA) protein
LAFIIVKIGEAEDAGKIFPLNKAETIIGRRTSQYTPDIELSSEIVSRRHLVVLEKNGKYMVKDLGSTNGTMLDDDRIVSGKLYEVKQGSKIGLGVDGDTAHVILQFKESEGTNIINRKKAQASRLKISWLKIDVGKKEVWVDGKLAGLSKKEYELLIFLYDNAGNICTRDQIIGAVWPESQDPGAISDATIDQLIHRLREKVEKEPAKPSRIISKKAFGYMLA